MSLNRKADDIEAAAASWFERREWSHWDEAAERELQAWLSESTAHRIAFIRLEAAWERAERLKALGAGVPPGQVPERGTFGFAPDQSAGGVGELHSTPSDSAPSETSPRRFKWAAALGVTSLALGIVASVWYQSVSRWQSYGTQVGTIAPVALADGSRITLDSNTRIQVALDTDQRLIRLNRGAALFDVAKDPTRPMIVEVGEKRVTAVGTEFSVRRSESDEITVMVNNGRVRIEGTHDRGQATELDAGSQASAHGNELIVERIGLDAVSRALSWREGYLVFDDTPLPQVVTDFNRYRTQKIEIDDPSIDSIRIGGRFRCTDASTFLTLLEQGFPVSVTRDGNHVSLRRR